MRHPHYPANPLLWKEVPNFGKDELVLGRTDSRYRSSILVDEKEDEKEEDEEKEEEE